MEILYLNVAAPPAGIAGVIYDFCYFPLLHLRAGTQARGREAKGRVAVRMSTGEPGGHNFIDPNLIADLVRNSV